jgi:nucleoid DNA-binding protein
MLTQAESLTEAESQLAHNLAITLVKEDTDVNELGKVIAYLRSIINQTDAGTRFFKYLKTLVTNGRQIGHSGRTTDYYRNIERACSKYLQSEQNNAHSMLKILGWAMRLMRYYKVSPVEEMTLAEIPEQEQLSERQAEIAKVLQSQKFQIDQVLDAVVISVKGNKVTYEMLGTIKMTEKEPKKATSLKEGQVVNVKIIALKDDGSIKSVKCI